MESSNGDPMSSGNQKGRAAFPENVVSALWRGRKIEAIKTLREEWKIDLKEAKEEVDRYIGTHPSLERNITSLQAESMRSWLPWVLLVIAILVGGYFFSG